MQENKEIEQETESWPKVKDAIPAVLLVTVIVWLLAAASDELGTHLAAAGNAVAAMGTLAAVAATIFALQQLKLQREAVEDSRRVARAQFLLDLDVHLREHVTVHKNLRPGGRWSQDEGPESAEEWIAVEQYMGLFERIYVLIESGIIDMRLFARLYGYRIRNITRNPVIHREKLEIRKEGWADFIALARRLEG